MNEETLAASEESKPALAVKVVPMCLPPGMIADMDKLAASEGMLRGRSVIARRAIKEYLSRHAPAEALSQEAA